MREMEETQSDFMQFFEDIPTQTYLGLTIGSILLSAFFYFIGRRSTALFVGQWAPTFGIFALVYKLLHPSGERPLRQMEERGRELAGRMGR